MKLNSKTSALQNIGKVKVMIELSTPLKFGIIASFEGKKLCLDFKYELLPQFHYSRRKIGHYVKDYEVVTFNEERFDRRIISYLDIGQEQRQKSIASSKSCFMGKERGKRWRKSLFQKPSKF